MWSPGTGTWKHRVLGKGSREVYYVSLAEVESGKATGQRERDHMKTVPWGF